MRDIHTIIHSASYNSAEGQQYSVVLFDGGTHTHMVTVCNITYYCSHTGGSPKIISYMDKKARCLPGVKNYNITCTSYIKYRSDSVKNKI